MNTYNKQHWVDIVALKSIFQMIQGWAFWEFLGGPVMVWLCASISGGTGPIRVWRTKIPQVMHCCQEIRGWIFLSLTYFAVKKCFSSVQFSRSVMSNSLQPHEPQHTRPPCPSPTAWVYPNTCSLSLMPFNHLIVCCPLLLLPLTFPSIRVFSNESALHIRWP